MDEENVEEDFKNQQLNYQAEFENVRAEAKRQEDAKKKNDIENVAKMGVDIAKQKGVDMAKKTIWKIVAPILPYVVGGIFIFCAVVAGIGVLSYIRCTSSVFAIFKGKDCPAEEIVDDRKPEEKVDDTALIEEMKKYDLPTSTSTTK